MPAETTDDATYDGTSDGEGKWTGPMGPVQGITSKLFASCAQDAKGSVHRAWGITLLFITLFFVMSILEVVSLDKNEGSKALQMAAVWTGIIQLIIAILGTFILKRFPTSFSVGFFIGLIVIVAQQNLIMFATFRDYGAGSVTSNHIFANLALSLFIMYSFFALILGHFRERILLSPADDKTSIGGRDQASEADGGSYGNFESR
jgi:hypothetical protein